MTDVFISYARNDRNEVRYIAHALTAEGFSVWWDPEIKPGKKWNDVIRRSLDSAAVVLTCWTPASVKSQWVVAETNAGHQRDMLVPVLLKNSHPPIPFNMMQAPDLTRWRGNANDPEWRAVLAEVRRLVEKKRRAAVAAPPPGDAEGRVFDGRATHAPSSPSYRISRTQGRMGPRIGQFVLGTVVIGAVLTAGLWAGEYAMRDPAQPRTDPPQITSPEPSIAPTPTEIVAPVTPAPATSLTVEEERAPDPPPRPTPPPPQATPTPISTPATPAPVPVRENQPGDLAAVDNCTMRIARVCPQANGQSPLFFSTNGRISNQERRFLSALGVDARTVLPATVQQCDAVLDGLSRRRAPAGFDRACQSVIFPSDVFGGFQRQPQATAPATSAPTTATPTTPPPGTTTGTTRPPVTAGTTAPPAASTGINTGVIYREGASFSTATRPTEPVIR